MPVSKCGWFGLRSSTNCLLHIWQVAPESTIQLFRWAVAPVKPDSAWVTIDPALSLLELSWVSSLHLCLIYFLLAVPWLLLAWFRLLASQFPTVTLNVPNFSTLVTLGSLHIRSFLGHHNLFTAYTSTVLARSRSFRSSCNKRSVTTSVFSTPSFASRAVTSILYESG